MKTHLHHAVLAHSLQIKHGLCLANRLIQGPLAGYSCAPFRALTARYGKPAFCCTEMISAKDLRYREKKPQRYLWRDPEETTTCYQISGNDTEDIKYASEIVTQSGADIIDLNCGCPVKKIRSKHCGSKLIETPELIYQLVQAMKNNSDAAVSIKIRVAEPQFDCDDIGTAQAAEAAGADFISVHGRHWTERYDVDCRLESIAKIVKAVTIPVFANGDVECAKSALKTLQQTQCAGLMIARASVGDPWLFQRILKQSSGETFNEPTLTEIGATFIEHLHKLIELENEHLAVLQSRKLAKYYARHLSDNKKPFIIAAQQATQVKALEALILHSFR